jgi:hypothetical protein
MKKTLLAAAISGMILGLAGAAKANNEQGEGGKLKAGAKKMADPPKSDKHACKGKNECKGKGGCKTDKHECKGKNECKGQGGCATDGSKKK